MLLGGTAEAAALSRTIVARFGDGIALTTSLAGRTERPVAVAGDVRIGGFGGADGLAAYLRNEAVDLVIDATHPFADRISAHARVACEIASVARLMLLRPPWKRHPLDRWIEVDDLVAAASVVGKIGRRAFLTVGSSEIAAFASAVEVRFLVRMIDAPSCPLPLRFYEIVLGRGPFTLAAERHLLQRHAIDVVVCKASGGDATEAKVIAAREASLPVVMVRRPPTEPGEAVASVEAALDWIAARIEDPPLSTLQRGHE